MCFQSQPNLVQCRREHGDHTRAGCWDHGEPFWRLSTTMTFPDLFGVVLTWWIENERWEVETNNMDKSLTMFYRRGEQNSGAVLKEDTESKETYFVFLFLWHPQWDFGGLRLEGWNMCFREYWIACQQRWVLVLGLSLANYPRQITSLLGTRLNNW